MKRDDLVRYLDKRLSVKKYSKEDNKNGLILKGKADVKKIGISVNTTIKVIEKAKKAGVDFLFVHHGGWKDIDLDMLDKKKKLFKDAGISLYVAHASMDCAKGVGMSLALAEALGLKIGKKFCKYCGGFAGTIGLSKPISLNSFVKRVNKTLGVKAKVWKNNKRKVKKVGIVTGGGGMTTWIKEAKTLGADTYLTGEVNMFSVMYSEDSKVNLIAATHYGTERHGLLALAKELQNKFKELKVIELKDKVKEL